MEPWVKNTYLLCVSQFMVMSAFSIIIPFVPIYLERDLGVATGSIDMWTGWIFGITFLSGFMFQPLWGRIGDRWSRKYILVISALGMAAVTCIMCLSTTPIELLLGRFLLGVVGGFIPSTAPFISMNTPRDHLGYALGLSQAGATVGNILGPLFGGIIGEYCNFNQVLLISAGLLLFTGLAVAFFLEEMNKPSPSKEEFSSNRGFVEESMKVLSSSPIGTLFFSCFLIQFSISSTSPFISILVQESWHKPTLLTFLVGVTVSVTGISIMLSSPFLGKIVDKKGSESVLLICLTGSFLSFIAQAISQSIWILFLFRFISGIFIGGLFPSINHLIRRYAPTDMESLTFGYSNSFRFLGNLLGPIAGGWLSGMINIKVVFIVAGVLYAVNALWFRVQMQGMKVRKA